MMLSDGNAFARLWDDGWALIAAGYAHAPAVMIGLAALLVLPPLALIGLVFYRRPRAPLRSPPGAKTIPAPGTREAWIELEDGDGTRCPIGAGPIRIGRHADNEICLSDTTVHRFHAVIQSTFDSGIVLKDVSGPGGNGVKLNGARVDQAVLADGDTVEIGKQRLRFGASALIGV